MILKIINGKKPLDDSYISVVQNTGTSPASITFAPGEGLFIKIMPESDSKSIYDINSNIVGTLDKKYDFSGKEIIFKEIVLTGKLYGVLTYNNKNFVVKHVETIIGYKVDMSGGRGPVWEDVACEQV
jgi:hypothetical protein